MFSNNLSQLLTPFSLLGKTALVTGASSGLGRHFAIVLAQAGAKVILAARRTERLEETCEYIKQAGGEAAPVALDVTSGESVLRAFSEAEEIFGCIDTVVNNAGIVSGSLLIDMTDDEWDAVLDTNLRGAMLVTREAAKRLQHHGRSGSIINISSLLSQRTYTELSHYCVSKTALNQFTKSAALELGRNDIRVNAICPGYFATEMTGDFLESETGVEMASKIPQQRFGVLDDLNGPLLLMASEAGKFITGAVLNVDGGHSVVGIM
ncbi:MAG: SDR family oxidoreductase [Halioglobus sp.]